MEKCNHSITAKLIEIPGKDGHMWGTKDYEMDYGKLEKIAHKMATGEGKNYCYMEFVYCYNCGAILENNQVFTD